MVFSHVITIAEADWIRLHFSSVEFSGDQAGGKESFLRVSSLLDGASQDLDSAALAVWESSTGFFNGGAVRLELLAYPGTGNSRVVVDKGLIGT